ncbi:hypothetical protein AaE_008534 [Aphanomyces astaci]|uniref:Uncharacterized protein n=1 Tax=Aphanomyces astaci TaxID=112090 RepID=A0A6A4ZUM9_APHAT|nr:hypothetical protein AaE_008534 [Aphanomyces astaci]
MSTDSPRKKLGFFGKADEVPAATAGGPALPPFFKHDVDLRPHALAVYDVDASTGNCTRLVDKLTSGQPRHWIVHAFTGPLLGLVRCAMPDDGALKPSKATTMSTVSDSTSIVTGSSITTGEATTGMHMTLEFYEWGGDGAEDIAGKSSVSTALHKVGPTLGGPLLVEWEHSGKYAVLVYPTKCHVIKWEGHSSKLLPLHEMSTPRPVQSVLWVHHALFTATEDEIKCYFICGSRTFSFVIASTTSCFDGQEEMNQTVDLADFPAAQRHPGGPLMLLGVFQEKLLCGGIMHQSMHSVTLKHPVLQFCMFVAQGVPKRALEVVPMISADLLDWMATFLEAFGFAADALDVPGTSSHVKVSICIKHMLVHTLADLLPSLVASVATDSADMMGTSLIQRACAALCRGGQEAAVAALLPTCMQMNKWNDALVMAMLVQDRATMAQVLASNQELSHALHTSNKNADVEAQWNQQMDAHGQIRPARFAGTWM